MRFCQWIIFCALFLVGCTQDPNRATIVDGGTNVYLPATAIAEEGDNWHTLAIRYKVRAEDLAKHNHSTLLEAPYAGKKIYIPGYTLHQVKRKEYLAMIARYYGSNLDDIKRRNKLATDTIQVEQILEIPVKRKNTLNSPADSSRVKPAQDTTKQHYHTPAEEAKTGFTNSLKAEYEISSAPQQLESTGSSKFGWPVRGKILHGFGSSTHKGITYEGISISAPLGAPIRAAARGVVAYTGNQISGYGNLTIIKHDGNWFSAYGHQQNITVKLGQNIARGEVIGTVGNTGKATATQLYFSLRKGEQPIDPLGYLGK